VLVRSAVDLTSENSGQVVVLLDRVPYLPVLCGQQTMGWFNSHRISERTMLMMSEVTIGK
jgi:hypothetical protein